VIEGLLNVDYKKLASYVQPIMSMHNINEGIEVNYNAHFRNCERDDYELMFNESIVYVPDIIKNQNDTVIGTKLCPTMTDKEIDSMYISN
jgi:hypothetical protein